MYGSKKSAKVASDSDPVRNAEAVTLGADVTFDQPRILYIGTGGDVSVTTIGGNNVVYKNVPVGFLPVVVTGITDATTSATNIISHW